MLSTPNSPFVVHTYSTGTHVDLSPSVPLLRKSSRIRHLLRLLAKRISRGFRSLISGLISMDKRKLDRG